MPAPMTIPRFYGWLVYVDEDVELPVLSSQKLSFTPRYRRPPRGARSVRL